MAPSEARSGPSMAPSERPSSSETTSSGPWNDHFDVDGINDDPPRLKVRFDLAAEFQDADQDRVPAREWLSIPEDKTAKWIPPEHNSFIEHHERARNARSSHCGRRGTGGSAPLTMLATAKLPDAEVAVQLGPEGMAEAMQMHEQGHATLGADNDQWFIPMTERGEPTFDIDGISPMTLKAIFGTEAMPLELDEDDEICFAPQKTAIKVALDSGAADHVINPDHVPGHAITPSAGSKAGKHFLAAGGHRIENKGEINVVVSGEEFPGKVRSTFQAAEVTRPLLSVSKICDAGCKVLFDKDRAVIKKNGKIVGGFKRRGGLYVADLTVQDPGEASGFTGPGRQR